MKIKKNKKRLCRREDDNTYLCVVCTRGEGRKKSADFVCIIGNLVTV